MAASGLVFQFAYTRDVFRNLPNIYDRTIVSKDLSCMCERDLNRPLLWYRVADNFF